MGRRERIDQPQVSERQDTPEEGATLFVTVTVHSAGRSVARMRGIRANRYGPSPAEPYRVLVGLGIDALNEAADTHAKQEGVELHPQGGEHAPDVDTHRE